MSQTEDRDGAIGCTQDLIEVLTYVLHSVGPELLLGALAKIQATISLQHVNTSLQSCDVSLKYFRPT